MQTGETGVKPTQTVNCPAEQISGFLFLNDRETGVVGTQIAGPELYNATTGILDSPPKKSSLRLAATDKRDENDFLPKLY